MKKKTNYVDYDLYDFLKDEFFILWSSSDDPEVADFWERWLQENAEKQEVVHQARQLLSAFDYKDKAILDDESYIDLYESILKEDKASSNKSKRFKRFTMLYKVAATVAILIIALVFVNTSENATEIEPVTTIAKATKPGEKKTVKLPDGSMVKINADSRLTYNSDYGSQFREIELEGEAFFDVVKNERIPFVVKTSAFHVQVLGTSFNVKDHIGDADNTVALATGRVEIRTSDNQPPVVMRPGELAIKKAHEQIQISQVDLARYIDWKDGVLTFEKNDFESVIVALSRWYGVEFSIVGNIPSSDTFSGKFNNENLENVLEVLSYSSRFTYEINNKTITIKF